MTLGIIHYCDDVWTAFLLHVIVDMLVCYDIVILAQFLLNVLYIYFYFYKNWELVMLCTASCYKFYLLFISSMGFPSK